LVLLSAFFLIPAVSESSLVARGAHILDKSSFSYDQVSLKSLIDRQPYSVGHKGYIGLSGFLLTVPGLAWLFISRRFGLLACLAFGLLLVLGYELPFYKYIPLVYSQGATSRFIIYVILFIAISSACTATWLSKRMDKKGWLVVCAACLVVWFDVRVTSHRTWPGKHAIADIAQHISPAPGLADKTIRSMLVCTGEINWRCNVHWPTILALLNKSSSLTGHFYQGAPQSVTFIEKIVRSASDGSLTSPAWKELAALTGLTHLVALTSRRTRLISFPERPLIVAGAIETFKEGSLSPEEILESMDINPKAGTAVTIPVVQTGIVTETMPRDPAGTRPFCEVKTLSRSIDGTFYDIAAGTGCYISLPHSWYPHLVVTVDGSSTRYLKTAYGMIALKIPEGRHTINIGPAMSPLRKLCLMISCVSFVGIVVFLVWEKKTRILYADS